MCDAIKVSLFDVTPQSGGRCRIVSQAHETELAVRRLGENVCETPFAGSKDLMSVTWWTDDLPSPQPEEFVGECPACRTILAKRSDRAAWLSGLSRFAATAHRQTVV